MAAGPDRYLDGAGWEEFAGYARAVRRGDRIEVSGTTAHGPDGAAIHPGDTGAQTGAALDRALAALGALGGSVGDVVRTRLLLAPEADWEAAARAHERRFVSVRPANTTVFVHGLVGDGFLVEVEIEAQLLSGDVDRG